MTVEDERVATGDDDTGRRARPARRGPTGWRRSASSSPPRTPAPSSCCWPRSPRWRGPTRPWSASYESFWHTEVVAAVRQRASSSLDLRHWINDGFMAFFFFVVGLEIRREFDMGELRERRRVATPVLAAIGGMVAPALIYLAINVGEPTARGWGIAMGTDTAFALGVLTLVGGATPRVRTFLLTLVIVDDIVALLVIALAYTSDLSWVRAGGGGGAVRRRARAEVARGAATASRTSSSASPCGSPRSPRACTPPSPGSRSGLLATAYPPSRDDADQRRRPVAPVPRGADPAVRPHGQPVAGAVGVAQRAPAEPVPPVDQLRRRAALRPRQRRGDPRGRGPAQGADRADLHRHRGRPGRGQAARHRRHDLARVAAAGSAGSPARCPGHRWSARPRSPASASRCRCSSPTSSFEGVELEEAKLGILARLDRGVAARLAGVHA